MLSQTGQARRTALSVGSVLLALAVWSAYRHHPIRAESLGSAGGVLLFWDHSFPGTPLHFITPG